MKWQHKRLADLGVVSTGSTPRTAFPHFYGGDIPFVTPADLDSDQMITTTPRTLSAAGAAEARMLPEGAVMICCIGTLGKIGIAGRSLATNQQINSVVFDRSLVFPKFGYYACRLLKPAMECMAPATTLPIISKSKFQELQIPLPPLAEQKRIAAILDAADALRTKRRESIAQLDALLQSTFLTLFGDPVENPMGWETANLESLSLKITDGDHHTPIRTESGIKLLSARNVLNGEIDFSNTDFVGEAEYARMIKRCHPERGDVLISCSGSIGRVSRIKFEEPIVLVRSAALVKIDHTKTFPEFVEYLLRTPALQIAMQRAAKSVAQANLFQQPIKNLPVFIPPLPLQQKFAAIVESVERQKAAQRAHLAELDALFAALQHRAFRGEL